MKYFKFLPHHFREKLSESGRIVNSLEMVSQFEKSLCN